MPSAWHGLGNEATGSGGWEHRNAFSGKALLRPMTRCSWIIVLANCFSATTSRLFFLGSFLPFVLNCWFTSGTHPTVGETQALLQTVRNQGGYPTNLVARMLYGCGLRVSEPLNLRIKDIDLERRRLCIRGAKGAAQARDLGSPTRAKARLRHPLSRTRH